MWETTTFALTTLCPEFFSSLSNMSSKVTSFTSNFFCSLWNDKISKMHPSIPQSTTNFRGIN